MPLGMFPLILTVFPKDCNRGIPIKELLGIKRNIPTWIPQHGPRVIFGGGGGVYSSGISSATQVAATLSTLKA